MDSSNRTALVLGAHGFVGRHVCRALAAEGTRVTGVGHGDWSSQEARAWGVERWIRANIDLPTLQAIPWSTPPEAVLHCGGSGAVSFSYARPLEDFGRSVDTTAAALEWVRTSATPDTRVVVVSSAAVYGDQGEVDLTETATRAPMSPYGFHKVAAEGLCDSWSRFFGISVTIVRLFSVYGEGLGKQLLWDAMNKFERGENAFFGTGHELRDWIHIEDAARLLCIASRAPQANFEVFNGGHRHATTREVLSILARAAACAREPRFNGETHAGNPRRLTANCGHARRQLGWTPEVELEAGLVRYAQWFRSMRADDSQAS